MKLQEEIKLIKTDRASLRSFAWIVGGVFLLLGLLAWRKMGNWMNPFAVFGVTLLSFGVVAPLWLKPVYIGWMVLGLLMGMVVAPLTFALLFFIAVTPISLIARLSGKKFLNMQFKTVQKSYWITKVKKQNLKESAEKQF